MSAETLRKQIFVGCRELGLDNETRRDLQLRVTGKSSMSDMTERDFLSVVSELKSLGFKAETGKKRPRAKRRDVRYCHVLWGLLGAKGHVRVHGAKGLNAFIRSRFEEKWGHVPIDIDAMTDTAEIRDVIEALKSWCTREDIPTETGGT
ncbi:regulatory protein GemA [Thalassovita sp.]|uniref:regulatory protein GemA n=1 Tax=Thalassovita sp. TaxID=1979401 RepID=UPI002B27714E|nr:regulatory protein GemA [Thalassovita sp.]